MAIDDMMVTVREATEADTRLYFEWANDPVVREMAFNTGPIPWESHVSWFQKKIESKDSLLVLCYQGYTPVGQVRFDVNNKNEAEIDISIAKEHRGKGLGTAMLTMAINFAHEHKGIKVFLSEVKENNLPSQRLFLSTGFTLLNKADGVCYFNKTIE